MADDRAPDRDFTSGDVSLARRLGNWRTIASIVFALALLFFLFRVVLNVDFGEVWRLVIGANPVFLLLAFLAYYTTFPLRGLRWHFVLARTGTHVRYRDATEILFLSWFVNCLVPAKLGDLYRAYLLKGNYGASGSRTVGTVFIERVADI
ncbi:MAG: lysylphosphatidylglycerol synthase transmembrane domain-containing protein, partial [Candidatus Limnocylindria bacterium]